METERFLYVLLICCIQCSEVQSVCEDNDAELKKTPLRLKKYPQGKTHKIKSCSNLVKKYAVLCKDHGMEGGLCCQKCKSVDLNCIDDYRPPPTINITSGESFSNCKSFIKKYPCKCLDESVNVSCCKSCQGVKCQDDLQEPPEIKLLNGDSFRRCDDYIHNNPCRCINVEVKELCGETCQESQDLYDIHKGSIHMFVHLVYQKNLTDYSSLELLLKPTLIQQCSELVDRYPALCSGPTSGQMCCLSCLNVDVNCVDNLYWKTDITIPGHNCTDCNCHQIHEVSPELLSTACHNDVKGTNLPEMGAREACCHQCGRIGFLKPEGYQTPQNLHYGLETIG